MRSPNTSDAVANAAGLILPKWVYLTASLGGRMKAAEHVQDATLHNMTATDEQNIATRAPFHRRCVLFERVLPGPAQRDMMRAWSCRSRCLLWKSPVDGIRAKLRFQGARRGSAHYSIVDPAPLASKLGVMPYAALSITLSMSRYP